MMEYLLCVVLGFMTGVLFSWISEHKSTVINDLSLIKSALKSLESKIESFTSPMK